MIVKRYDAVIVEPPHLEDLQAIGGLARIFLAPTYPTLPPPRPLPSDPPTISSSARRLVEAVGCATVISALRRKATYCRETPVVALALGSV